MRYPTVGVKKIPNHLKRFCLFFRCRRTIAQNALNMIAGASGRNSVATAAKIAELLVSLAALDFYG